MASFSAKKYFSKIHSPDVLIAYYKTHDIQAFFEIGEQTSRKQATDIMLDFYISLSPEQKYDIERELALIESLSTKFAPDLFIKVLEKNGVDGKETLIECETDHDKVLYYYTHHKEIVDEVFFFHDFYTTKGYMLYEAKKVTIDTALAAVSELTREFVRIANKEDRVTKCEVETKSLDNLLYVHATFDGAQIITPTKNKETGELDRTATVRKLEQVRIVYMPEDSEILISYTGGKHEKLIFLDTFLRVVCNDGYTDKEQSFDLSFCKNKDFDFAHTNKGVPLLTWKIKSVALSFGERKQKKKIKIALPANVNEHKLSPLFATIEELNISSGFSTSTVESASLTFSFTNPKNPQKAILVPVSVSSKKSSLSPLFPYDRYARSLLKNAKIDKGFVEKAAKEKENLTKKWEV